MMNNCTSSFKNNNRNQKWRNNKFFSTKINKLNDGEGDNNES